ncbi:hypothetical protein NP493_363g02016 [Ridgeia piscesae]|uniref:Uncharacterized protein n=1 Tax=Ridgeia piscesae TaxID=27915 RepID=A0AAD9L3L1_RIDPI|nr:hypothetical protein NP493_363g02016 [Ridgeia piscesae]
MARLSSSAITLPTWRLLLIKSCILVTAFLAILPANVLCTSEETSQLVITTTSHPDIVSTAQAPVQQRNIPDTREEFIPLANLNRQQHHDESPFNTGILTGIVIGVFLLVFLVTAITSVVVRYRRDMRNEMATRRHHQDVEADNEEMEACRTVKTP